MQKHSQQFHNIFVHISSFSYGSYNKVLSRIPFIYPRLRVLTEGLYTARDDCYLNTTNFHYCRYVV